MTIRPLERDDLDDVVGLYASVMRPEGAPMDKLRHWFEQSAFDHPWADPEIPSLVAVNDRNSVEGFLVSHARRLRIDGRPARLACSGQLVAHPVARRRAAGARLLRTYMKGPQDLTITDGATETVRAVWERLGGELAHPQSIDWWRPLRLGSLAGSSWAARGGRSRPSRTGLAAARAGDALASLLPDRWLARAANASPAEDARAPAAARLEPLTADSLVSTLPSVVKSLRLHPDYDRGFFSWLLDELAAARDDELRARLVQGPDGGVLGWFVYYLVPGGISPAISVAAGDEASCAGVLDALLDDARAGGAAALRGRLEPRLVAPAAARGCLFRYAGQALVHARDPAVVALATSRHALLTRLEGEWWMNPHLF